jgi:pectate lyase
MKKVLVFTGMAIFLVIVFVGAIGAAERQSSSSLCSMAGSQQYETYPDRYTSGGGRNSEEFYTRMREFCSQMMRNDQNYSENDSSRNNFSRNRSRSCH